MLGIRKCSFPEQCRLSEASDQGITVAIYYIKYLTLPFSRQIDTGKNKKQEANGPLLAHLSQTAIADMQM